MIFEAEAVKTSATLDDIYARVGFALARHPLCRSITFDVVRTPLNRRGSNWTVTMDSIGSDAIWEATEIVADIQQAYHLVADIRDNTDFAFAA